MPFQLAWEYLLFDNRMIHARTRLVLPCARFDGDTDLRKTERFKSSFRS
jgi:hypothetical protein